MDLEERAIRRILHPNVVGVVKSHLEPQIMFNKRIFRMLAEAIKDDPNLTSGKVTPEYVPYMQSKFDLQPGEVEVLTEIIGQKEEIENMDTTIAFLEQWMKKRLALKACEVLMSKIPGHLESFLAISERANHLSITSSDSFVRVTSASELMQIVEAERPPDGVNLLSSIPKINEKLTYGGYRYSDLVMVLGAPKTGKTTFMVQEGANIIKNGGKVLHFAIGDMTKGDILSKYIASLHEGGANVTKVTLSPEDYYEKVKEGIGNLIVREEPALMMTIDNLVSSARSLKKDFDYDFVVVDYDANISPEKDGMYESAGVIYGKLKGLAQQCKCVVMVGCQPKIDAWEKEALGKMDASESSRKQHAVDIMIGLGKPSDTSIVGTLTLPLVRRGESGLKAKIQFDYPQGRIAHIDQDQYKKLVDDNPDFVSKRSKHLKKIAEIMSSPGEVVDKDTGEILS